MSLLSLFSHVHAPSASPFAAPAAQAQSQGSPVVHQADSSSGTSGTGGSSSSGSSGDNSAAITANDFLTLLVTEIQNQDPTSQTDPMTYITQLVGVNSLQQLLQINQTLSTAASPGGPLAGGSTTPATGDSRTGNSPVANSAAASAAIHGSQMTAGSPAAAAAHLLPLSASGPATTASTNAVAQAFTHPAVMPPQVAPPTQVPLNPEVMRALEHSIPGAKLVGPSSGVQ